MLGYFVNKLLDNGVYRSPYQSGFRIRMTLMRIRIWIQLFTSMQIRIQIFVSMRIRFRILLLIEVMRICDHTCLQNLQGSIFRLHASTVSFHGPPKLHFENLKFLSFDFNAEPDPNIAFHSYADPDPVSKKMRIDADSDPDPQP